MIWAGNIAYVGEMSNTYQILVRKSEGNRPLWRLRHRWEDNIKMDFKETGYEGVDLIHMAQRKGFVEALLNSAFALHKSREFLEELSNY
jgi:hypothetical protein